MAAKKKTKKGPAKPRGSGGASSKKKAPGKKAAPKGGSPKKGAKKAGSSVKAKKKAGATRKKTTAKKGPTGKAATKKVGAKKAAKKAVAKVTTKKVAGKKTATKKSSKKKAVTKKTTKKKSAAGSPSKVSPGEKLTAQGILKKRAEAKKAADKKAAAQKAAEKKPAGKKVKKVAVKKVSVVAIGESKQASQKGGAKKGAAKKTAPKAEVPVEVETKAPPAPKQRSQPVEVQEIDVRTEKEQRKRLPSYRPKSYGKKPKPASAGEILKILIKFLGKAPTFKRELKGLPLVHLGMFCVFAVGGNPPKVCLEAVKRLVEAFPDWNEFRISDPLEFVEILEDLEIDNLYNRCERVLEFINDVYQDQNGVDLEFLRQSDTEDRLTILDRYVSLGPALAHFLALGIQGFEGVLFHYSWARVVQRLGLVPRSGSPKVLLSSFAKVFKGKDLVTAQVNLIDLGEEICLSKNQSCRSCYLVLHCKGRKV